MLPLPPPPLRLWFPGPVDAEPELPVLLCLAGAGGGPAEFRDWVPALRGRVSVAAVALPGRERRIAESPRLALRVLVDRLVRAARPLLARPYALFGHSLGALLGYEVARSLPAPARANLRHLFVSAQPAPRWSRVEARTSELPDGQLLDYLRRLGGTPEEVLASPAFMRPYLRCLRADLALEEQYDYRGEAGLDCPLTVFRGRSDTEIAADRPGDWARETSGPFRVVDLTGGHFSLRDDRGTIVEEIARSLDPPRAGPDGAAR